jgi:small subunit ribosomal protein S8
MSLSDPIADMLTRIRNGIHSHRTTVNIRASGQCEGLASVLKLEGYIDDYARVDDGTKQGTLRLSLRYSPVGEDVIQEIQRVSKPGRRVYRGVDELPRPLDGMGISIVSTSKGVLSDRQCREQKLGGEVLCTVC